ncbi:MAG: hypothetical protein ACSLEN_13190 [Candidatus Malihini olakiniferum]
MVLSFRSPQALAVAVSMITCINVCGEDSKSGEIPGPTVIVRMGESNSILLGMYVPACVILLVIA